MYTGKAMNALCTVVLRVYVCVCVFAHACVYTGKAMNALCTVALKIASMCVGYVITDDSAKAFGNGVQVLSCFNLFLLTILSLLSSFFYH